MTLDFKIRKEKCSNSLEQISESIRVLREREIFLIGKIKEVERKEKVKLDKLKELASKFKYLEVKKLLEEENGGYLHLIEKQELPYVNNLKSLIYFGFSNLNQDVNNFLKDEFLPTTIKADFEKIYQSSIKLDELITKKIIEIQHEIKLIKEALQNRLPLEDLEQINNDELRENELDNQIRDLNNIFYRGYDNISKNVKSRISFAIKNISEFEEKHKKIKDLVEITKEDLEKLAYARKSLEEIPFLMFSLKIATNCTGVSESFQGAKSIFSGILGISDFEKQLKELGEIVEISKSLNLKLSNFEDLPEIQKSYIAIAQEVYERYKGMEIKY